MVTRPVCLLMFFVALASSVFASDVGATNKVSWTEATPVVTRSYPLTPRSGDDCSTYVQELFIKELQQTKSVCVYGDERLTIGIFYDAQGVTNAVVIFPYGTEVHLLHDVCRGLRCRYSADTDTMITEQYPNQYGSSLVIYKNISTRIKEMVSDNNVHSYVFDSGNIDYEAKNTTGGYLRTSSFSLSENGEWAVMELKDSGLGVVNIKDMSAKQILFEGYTYGLGRDPFEQLAISNDGKTVVLTGVNAGLSVIEVNESCGQPLIGNLLILPSTERCKTRGLTFLFPWFQYAEKPRLFAGGSELEIRVKTSEDFRIVTVASDGKSAGNRLKFLSIGDSFSSGEGETDDSYYNPATNQAPDSCHVSRRAYGGLFALRLGIHTDEGKNIACSGAKIADIVSPTKNYWGQGGRLGTMSAESRDVVRQQALDDYGPGRTLQLDFVDRYRPEMLTIGVGGNDAGLMGKLRVCAMPGTCEWATADGASKTAAEIERLYGKLTVLFSKIQSLTRDSQVFVLGYPSIIEPDGSCDPVTGILFDAEERRFVAESITHLNKVIRAASIELGFVFVDVEKSFAGQNLCSGGAGGAMNSLRLGDDISLTSALPMLKLIGAETFHPTPQGHVLIADALMRAYQGETSVVSEGLSPINPLPREETFVAEFVRRSGTTNEMSITLPDGSLRPHSEVRLEVRSDPKHLATMIVDEKGAINDTVQLPVDLVEGFHTLHLYGVNNEGVVIDLYQFVTIGEVDRENAGAGLASSMPHAGGAIGAPGTAERVLPGVLGSTVSEGSLEKNIRPITDHSKGEILLVLVILGCIVAAGATIVLITWVKPGS